MTQKEADLARLKEIDAELHLLSFTINLNCSTINNIYNEAKAKLDVSIEKVDLLQAETRKISVKYKVKGEVE